MAGVIIGPPLSCVKQSATSGTMPAPGDVGGAAWSTAGGTNGGGASAERGGSKVSTARGAAGVRGLVSRSHCPARPVADLAALGQRRRRRQRDQKSGEEGFKGRERLQVDGRKRGRGMELTFATKTVTIPNARANSCTSVLAPSLSLCRFVVS